MRFRRFLLPRLWICHYILHFHFVFSLCTITLYYHFVFFHFVPSFLLSLWVLSLCFLSLWAASAGSKLFSTEKQKNQTVFTQTHFLNLKKNNSWNLWTLELLDHFVNWATCRNCIYWWIEKHQLLTDWQKCN